MAGSIDFSGSEKYQKINVIDLLSQLDVKDIEPKQICSFEKSKVIEGGKPLWNILNKVHKSLVVAFDNLSAEEQSEMVQQVFTERKCRLPGVDDVRDIVSEFKDLTGEELTGECQK